MDFLQSVPPEWWRWAVEAFYGIDRLWLAAGVAVSLLLGIAASAPFSQSGRFWSVLVTVLVAGGMFLIFLALTGINPQFFDPEALARSQVSM